MCASCKQQLRQPPQRISTRVLQHVPVYSLGPYGGVRSAMIIGMKERGRMDMCAVFGAVLRAAVQSLEAQGRLPDGLWLVPAPTTLSNERARGGDPVFLACQSSRLPSAQLLRHATRVRDSAGLSAVQRRINISGAVQLLGTVDAPVLLVDDVITTGATLASSVAVLQSAGMKVAGCLGFSHA
ncbi:ComF family protein [Corynebacterium pseudopelargi]|uniref:ComF family protein n=1 Tax=Corynebacterium pseudopelargi TaxID=2080757 RepID=UPI001FE4D778|nr:ComF family protein [Corynebacterium pseudopelargi]